MKFSEADADAWFIRNEKSLDNLEKDAASQVMSGMLGDYITEFSEVLEIGCSTGARLNYLNRQYSAKYYGIDLSRRAIEFGQNNFKNLKLSVQRAESLNFGEATFDLVILGFFLYLVDRKDYASVVKEVVRVTKYGGYIGILDFDVPYQYSNPYAPNNNLQSYKCDNAQAFIETGQFTLIDKKSFSHFSPKFTAEIDQRISFQILYKEAPNINKKGGENV